MAIKIKSQTTKTVQRIFWRDLIINWSIIILCFFISYNIDKWWMWLIAGTIIGFMQYKLMILFHDLMHRTIFKKKYTNFNIGNLLIGWWVGVDIKSFNRFHGQHHAYNGTDKDPEMILAKGSPFWKYLGRWDLPMSPWKMLFWMIFDVVLGPILMLFFIFGMKAKSNENGTNVYCWDELIGPLLWVSGICGILWYEHQLWIVQLWFLSLFFVFTTLFNVRMLTEHFGCAQNETIMLDEPQLWYEWIYALVAGAHNLRYHYEHHADPKMPYMLLPDQRKKNLANNIKPIKLKTLVQLLNNSPIISSGEIVQVGDKRSVLYRYYNLL